MQPAAAYPFLQIFPRSKPCVTVSHHTAFHRQHFLWQSIHQTDLPFRKRVPAFLPAHGAYWALPTASYQDLALSGIFGWCAHCWNEWGCEPHRKQESGFLFFSSSHCLLWHFRELLNDITFPLAYDIPVFMSCKSCSKLLRRFSFAFGLFISESDHSKQKTIQICMDFQNHYIF